MATNDVAQPSPSKAVMSVPTLTPTAMPLSSLSSIIANEEDRCIDYHLACPILLTPDNGALAMVLRHILRYDAVVKLDILLQQLLQPSSSSSVSSRITLNQLDTLLVADDVVPPGMDSMTIETESTWTLEVYRGIRGNVLHAGILQDAYHCVDTLIRWGLNMETRCFVPTSTSADEQTTNTILELASERGSERMLHLIKMHWKLKN
jgi:hypothetical protein